MGIRKLRREGKLERLRKITKKSGIERDREQRNAKEKTKLEREIKR